MRRLLRSPALHFLVIGAALFVADRRMWPEPDPARSVEVVIPATRISAGEGRFAREAGRPPTGDERAALIDQAVDEELLYREAIARALDRDDRSINGHLAEKMRFLDAASGEASPGDDPALVRRAVDLGLDRSDAFVRHVLVEKMRLLARREGEAREPDDATLAAFMAAHPDAWRLPDRATLRHVFVGDGDAARAAALLAVLRSGAGDPARLGDAFPTERTVRDAARPTLAQLLGEEIAAFAFEGPVGEWSGPVRSPWGLHLVRVDARTAAAMPPLGAVRGRVLAAWREEDRRARERAALAELRRRWRVRVEGRDA